MSVCVSIPIFERGVGGIPTTAFVDDLRGRADSYEHAISATFGFESMHVPFSATREEAGSILANWLMRSTIVSSPDAEVCWEGVIIQIEAQFGQEHRSVSLDEGFANRIKARYSTVLDTPGVAPPFPSPGLSDTASQARYGIKDAILSLSKSTGAAALNFVTAELARRKNPVASPASEVKTGELGEVSVSLLFAGWYETLAWLLTSNSTTSTAITTAQVGSLLTTAAFSNAFVSASTAHITASGISDTQAIEPDTTIRDAIERLLSQGNSNGQRLAWGVYENREMHVKEWAGATPSAIAYRRYLGDGNVYTPAGGIVAPWNVRPNAMYEVVDLLDPAPVSTAQDTAARFYVERVTCTISGDTIGVTLEPQSGDSLDSRLARLK